MKTLPALGLLLIIISSPVASGALKLEFAGGGSMENPNRSSVDAYPGTLGDGWETEWKEVLRSNRSQLKVEVRDQHPFSSVAKTYLQMDYVDLESEVSASSGVQRAFSTNPAMGGIDPRKPYRIQFQFRLDSATEDFATRGDYVIFSGATGEAGTEQPGEEAWVVNYRTGLGWLVSVPGKKVNHRIGPKDFQLEPGVIWTVKLSLHPDASQLDVEIEGSNGPPFEARGIDADLMPGGMPPVFLNFLISRNGTDKKAVWSIDNIEIMQN